MNLLQDRIWGYLFGVAIGDALGLGTELMTKAEVRFRYPDGLRSYSQIVRDAHRVQWPVGAWTNDTELVMAMARTVAKHGRMESKDLAREISSWFDPEMSDITSYLRIVFNHPDFEENPEAASRSAWEQMNRNYASSEGLARCPMVGLWNNDVESKSGSNTKITHYDPRCVAVGTILAKCANIMAYGNRIPDPEEVKGWAEKLDPGFIPYIDIAAGNRLQEFQLDDEDKYWYARKSAGAALWAMWNSEDAETALNAIIMEAGDADTNGALAGGLLGIKFGYSALPKHLIEELRHGERIKSIAAVLSDLILNRFG